MSIFAKAKKARENKKGFTLVELIVVLVILAILAAVLVPTLLGWIDKARNSQITTNANAALVATQGLLDEKYGLKDDNVMDIDEAAIEKLTDDLGTFTVVYTVKNPSGTSADKEHYQLATFEFTDTATRQTATWNAATGNWTVA